MGGYSRSYELLNEVLQQIIEDVGPDHYHASAPKSNIARVLGHLGKYEESLRLFKDVLERMKKAGGHPLYLSTRANMASVMVRSGAYQEAIEHLQIVLEEQMRVSGPDDPDTLVYRTSLAKALFKLKRFSEAHEEFTQIFNNRKETLGLNHLHTLIPQFYLGQILVEQGDDLEALEAYNLVLERSKPLLSITHEFTQDVLKAIGVLKERMGSGDLEKLFKLERFPEALEVLTLVFNKRKEILGFGHPRTLIPQFRVGQILVEQGKDLEALETYSHVLDRSRPLLSEIQELNQNVLEAIDRLKERLGSKKFTELQTSCERSINSEEPHDPYSSGHKDGANDLLVDGLVDNTQVTTERRETPSQIDASKDKAEHNEYPFEHAEKAFTSGNLIKFIDAQTNDGDTALHFAARCGSLNRIKALLRYGATYNIKNKQGKAPLDLTNEPKIKIFLGLVDEVFEAAKRGDPGVISKLKALDKDEQLAIINARTVQVVSFQEVLTTKSLSDEFSKLSVSST